MLKYAQIINEQIKQCDVGLGTDIKFFKSIGMKEMEVEQGYDNNWYLKGYAPQKPQELINQEKIAEYQKYLADTDYVVVKISEAIAENDEKLLLELKNKYSSVLQKRKETRNNIKELENISTNFNQE